MGLEFGSLSRILEQYSTFLFKNKHRWIFDLYSRNTSRRCLLEILFQK